MLAALALAGCSVADKLSTIDPELGVSASPKVVADGDPVPKGGGYYKLGKPYTIGGKQYVPQDNPNYVAEGTASWYGKDFHGRKTANGEIFDMASVSAAHKTLPMPSYVRVTNLANKRSIIVRVNNRGPYVGDRLIDLSYRTAELLGFAGNGVARVRVEYVGRAPIDGSDDTRLAMTLRDDGKPAELNGTSNVMVASARSFVPDVKESAPRNQVVPLPLSRPYDLGESAGAPRADAPAPARTPSGTAVAAAGWSQGAAPVSGLGYAGVPADGR
ncbi:septal ring lytic transglycosylase RlpA family protein [Xanthobacter tagetidis]|uniref:septal ring lytic transglycosylase RlpA family protein n=1 Tax=Xanthobacter tagetidis TaxID=60216 RepID=UPI0017EB716E|nr:septal ring lytic transglycosylase RlpA family protein [Xanthobacter tagetidis]MBB6309766.1 rare lipoprotein A [Xanthobacter tagetidis]